MAKNQATQAIIDEAAQWASEQLTLHLKVKPLAEHLSNRYAEVANAMAMEVVIAVVKGIECGIYLGKFGFPDERGPIPDCFDQAFNTGEKGGDVHGNPTAKNGGGHQEDKRSGGKGSG